MSKSQLKIISKPVKMLCLIWLMPQPGWALLILPPWSLMLQMMYAFPGFTNFGLEFGKWACKLILHAPRTTCKGSRNQDLLLYTLTKKSISL